MGSRRVFYACAAGIGIASSYFVAKEALLSSGRKYWLLGEHRVKLPRVLHAKSIDENSPNTLDEHELELLLVHVIFRHGARTPIRYLPGVEEAFWDKNVLMRKLHHTVFDYVVKTEDDKPRPPSGIDDHHKVNIFRGGSPMGHLTTLGQEQMYQLGQNLRKRYIQELKLIDSEFDSQQVYLRSSNIERTLQSLRCVVAGLYSKESLKEPVTFYTVSLRNEILYPNNFHCLRLDKLSRLWMRQIYGTRDVKNMRRTLADILQVDLGAVDFVGINDNIVARQAHNLPVPECLQPFLTKFPKWAVSTQLGLVNDKELREEILQLGVGKFLQLLMQKMEDSIQNKSSHKMYLFSCHDTSLMYLLASLGLKVEQWPPFASYITMELFRNKAKEHFVKVKYKGEDLVIPNCGGSLCTLEQFRETVSRYFIDDWKKACRKQEEEELFDMRSFRRTFTS